MMPYPQKGSMIHWVECDRCGKWRVCPKKIHSDTWFCEENTWDTKFASCDAPDQTVPPTTPLYDAVPSQSLSSKSEKKLKFAPIQSKHASFPHQKNLTKKTASNHLKSSKQSVAQAKNKNTKTHGTHLASHSSASNVVVEYWVQCDTCKKWRRTPCKILIKKWYCRLNDWDKQFANCNVPEEEFQSVEKSSKTESLSHLSAKAKRQSASTDTDDTFSKKKTKVEAFKKSPKAHTRSSQKILEHSTQQINAIDNVESNHACREVSQIEIDTNTHAHPAKTFHTDSSEIHSEASHRSQILPNNEPICKLQETVPLQLSAQSMLKSGVDSDQPAFEANSIHSAVETHAPIHEQPDVIVPLQKKFDNLAGSLDAQHVKHTLQLSKTIESDDSIIKLGAGEANNLSEINLSALRNCLDQEDEMLSMPSCSSDASCSPEDETTGPASSPDSSEASGDVEMIDKYRDSP